jgi:hypothetical protein
LRFAAIDLQFTDYHLTCWVGSNDAVTDSGSGLHKVLMKSFGVPRKHWKSIHEMPGKNEAQAEDPPAMCKPPLLIEEEDASSSMNNGVLARPICTVRSTYDRIVALSMQNNFKNRHTLRQIYVKYMSNIYHRRTSTKPPFFHSEVCKFWYAISLDLF